MSLPGLVSLLMNDISGLAEPTGSKGKARTCRFAARRGARPVYVAALWQRWRQQRNQPTLVITPRPDDSRRLHDQLLTYLGESVPVYLLPEPEVLPYERLAVDARTVNQRLVALAALASSGGEGPTEDRETAPLVIASVSAALRLTLPPEIIAGTYPGTEAADRIRVGQRIRSTEQLLTGWVNLGYRHEPVVESPGTFSQRGGIIDIFPPQSEWPYRLELWDDEVDTIRAFDPYTQRSIPAGPSGDNPDMVTIIPAREQLPDLADRSETQRRISGLDFSHCPTLTRERFDEELVELFAAPNIETLSFYNGLLNRANLLDYLPADGLLILDRQSQIETEALDLEEKFFRMRESREERGELPRNFPSPYLTWEKLAPRLEGHRECALLESWVGDAADELFRAAPSYYGQLEQFTDDVRRQLREGRSIIAVSQHARRLAEVLKEAEVGVSLSENLDTPPEPGHVYLLTGSLNEGWDMANGKDRPAISLLTDAELFGTVKERRYRPSRSKDRLGEDIVLSELVPGNYVVHIDHGVARFAGTTQMSGDEEGKEYLVLEYADNDKLYVPTDHLDRVGAYVGAQDQAPTLTRLGTAEWTRIKERVKGSTKELAEELLRLYAIREAAQGHEFSGDTVWQRELEDSFPYQETPDQVQAIDDVKLDMERPRPMDRLICGDVGYGKTEVALRAAFKTVSEGMQVGLLVPTTVLAQQHYATFSERLSPYPLQVEVLSRFRTPKEQQGVIEGLQEGTVDIVIGTHRLLQKDVRFKNLGLVVVDEEQRFGVGHKETLKRLRSEVDVLTLSATPIPRTLHMALSGIRDMSVMNTPPEARLPVKTFVSEYSEDTIREAILREVERGGQVFFLHNRVKTIQQTTAELSALVPEARFMIGHGRMAESDLEEVMVAFADGEADVLVCTTIIESGLDMPNVNTLILDRADRFGLSQLYQLRGRVGRGEHRAYAYLLLPRGRQITEAAEQRVQAILEAADLGSGFRIAMRDLEIRGAGNLLGAAQSGQIHAVGLDLYGQLLEEAVADLLEGGQESQQSVAGSSATELPRIELPVAASIPESYVPHTPTRLALYQRFARAKDRQAPPALREELRDRFGPLPPAVENLLTLVDLRVLAGAAGVESVLHSSSGITLGLRQEVGSAKVPLQRAMGSSVSVGNRQIKLSMRGWGDDWLPRLARNLERLLVFQERLKSMAG